ncbi:hypothetical protein NPIL_127661, partial [Nephila pilipes]
LIPSLNQNLNRGTKK